MRITVLLKFISEADMMDFSSNLVNHFDRRKMDVNYLLPVPVMLSYR